MKNYRLGNTITIKWTIMTATGTAYNLNASNLELFAVVPNHTIKIDDFSVAGNVVTWTFLGTDQKFTGPYTLTLIENRGQSTMMTVDYCNAFGLVRWSCQAGWDESADVNSNLSLTSEIFTHQIALSKEVQDAIYGNITEYNVSNHFPTDGIDGTNRYTLETAIAKIPASLRTVGIKCSFLNEAGQVETWEYQGGQYGFTYLTNWTQTSSGAILRLDRTTRSMSQFLNYGFIRIDGTINNIQEPNQWVNTGFIVIDKASKIELRAETANKYVNAIAFYDNNSSDEVYTIEPTEIPANCIYINVCARISQAGVYVGYKPYDYTSVIKKTVSFAGIATPDTDPGTTDQSVFYIATTAGVYSNFNNIIVAPNEVVIISNVTGNWKRTPVSVLSADFSLGLGNRFRFRMVCWIIGG